MAGAGAVFMMMVLVGQTLAVAPPGSEEGLKNSTRMLLSPGRHSTHGGIGGAKGWTLNTSVQKRPPTKPPVFVPRLLARAVRRGARTLREAARKVPVAVHGSGGHSGEFGNRATVLNIATLNIGGDGPQPEFLFEDWDDSFGDVEKSVGAEILSLHHCGGPGSAACVKEQLPAKYRERYEAWVEKSKPDGAAGLIGLLGARFPGIGDVLGPVKKKIGMTGEPTLSQFVGYLMGNKAGMEASGAIARNLEDLKALDRDTETCKRRKTFPFFGPTFMEMHKRLKSGSFTVDWYYENNGCDFFKSGLFVPLLLFDLNVFRHYDVFLEGKGVGEMPAATYLSDDQVKGRKLDIVDALLQRGANILMLQEAQDALGSAYPPAQGDMEIQATELKSPASTVKGVVATALTKKKKTNFDTAIWTSGGYGSGAPQLGNGDLTTQWTEFVPRCFSNAGGPGACEDWKLLSLVPEGATLSDEGLEEGKKTIDRAPETTIQQIQVGGQNVLLMSMHPNSNGRPCAFFAYLAREFFKTLPGLDLLLVGLDSNVMVDTEKNEKKTKADKNGFSWQEFRDTVEGLGMKAIYKPSGDGIAVHTVYKVRSFLQTQIDKAGKVDKVTKDVFLAYPAGKVVVKETEVWNVLKPPWWSTWLTPSKDTEFEFDGAKRFPSNNWVLDHFAVYASIEVH